MKISKTLGLGLIFHVLLVAVFIVQPSCTTMAPPTQTYQQSKATEPLYSSSLGDVIPDRSTSASLDPAFNAGLDELADRFTPIRPDTEFSEFDVITPKLSPIISDTDASTVEVAGPSFKMHTVQRGESLWAISRRYNVSLDDLYLSSGLNKNSVLSIGQQIKIPVEGSTATINTITADTYQPTGFNVESEVYKVVRGDTLSGIANRFNTRVSAIKAANNKRSDTIIVGEELIIPVNSSFTSPVASNPGNTASSSSLAEPSGNSKIHVVKAGEYPGTIARQYGIPTAELLAMNNINDPRTLQVGQKLKVAPSTKPVSAAQSTPKVTQTTTTKLNPVPASGSPVPIKLLGADPLIADNFDEIDTDSLFDDVDEIPLVPLEE